MQRYVDVVGNQIKDSILQSVMKTNMDVQQTITGSELHQLMIDSIRGYLPATTGKSGGNKKKTSLGDVLDKFVKLAEEPEICKAYEPLQVIEETILKHYKDGAKHDPNASMLKQLKLGAHKLHDAYSKVLKRRTTRKGRIKEWLHVIREGNDSFRNVYDKIWQEV